MASQDRKEVRGSAKPGRYVPPPTAGPFPKGGRLSAAGPGVAINDFGGDEVAFWPVDGNPRRLEVHPDGRFAVVDCFGNLEVLEFVEGRAQ